MCIVNANYENIFSPNIFKAGFKRASIRTIIIKIFIICYILKGYKAFPKCFKRVLKGFPKSFKAFQKGFKPSETGFPKGFTATSNPLENAFVDKRCFRMEGHILYW